MGQVIQVSVSRGGIPKRAVTQARLTAQGVESDSHLNLQYHGGPRQAVLWITSEGNAELAARGFPIESGTLGENITIVGVDRRDWRAGQRWRIGEALIELTKMRSPCKTLLPLGSGIHAALYDAAVKAGDPSSPVWGLGGFYAAVVEPGLVRTRDEIRPAE